MEAVLKLVATKVSTDWKWLGRELNIPECDIERVDLDNTKTDEKAFQILIKWYRTSGRSCATKNALVGALSAIKRTEIAEEVEKIDVHEDSPYENDLSKPTGRTQVISKFWTTAQPLLRHILLLGNQLECMLKNCHETLATSNVQSLVQQQRILQNIQNMEIILKDMIKDCEAGMSTEQIMEEIKQNHRRRWTQTDQTIRLIQNLLENCKRENTRTRPVSAIPIRCTSVADLSGVPRCSTAPAGSLKSNNVDISSPCFVSRPNTVQRDNAPRWADTNSHSDEPTPSNTVGQPQPEEQELSLASISYNQGTCETNSNVKTPCRIASTRLASKLQRHYSPEGLDGSQVTALSFSPLPQVDEQVEKITDKTPEDGHSEEQTNGDCKTFTKL